MNVPLEEILNELSPEHRQKIKEGGARLIAEERLRQSLKLAHQLTQTKIAAQLQIPDEEILDLEHRSETHLMMLQAALREMGGDLRLVIDLPANIPAIPTP
jgi:hypothetical protein